MIGAIARAHGDDPKLIPFLRCYQHAALEHIAACGTAACGLHTEICDQCADPRLVPNTCGHRSCPHCQGSQRREWVAQRERELLPGIGFYHAVFTVPQRIAALTKAFPILMLGILLQASADAVLTLCRDKKYLGAEVGLIEVLHTWSRELRWHPHVHQIITAGGWNAAEGTWIDAPRPRSGQPPFLLPVAVLRAAFQKRAMHLLLNAYEKGAFESGPHEAFIELASFSAFRQHLGAITSKRWCIRIEPPFGSPQILLRYLGAYINRVAISPTRILKYDSKANQEQGSVTWTWTTNAKPDQPQTKTQTGVEFLKDFAQHILPPRLVRIRFRGLWATAHRKTKLDRARAWLLEHRPPPPAEITPTPDPATTTTTHKVVSLPAEPPACDSNRCQKCEHGVYRRIPGPCPRPNRAVRKKILSLIRTQDRTRTPQEAIPLV